MKRIKKISIFLFFVLLLIPFTVVKAADATCADVTGAVSELEDINSMYNQLDCDNTTDTKSKYECNNLKVRRAAVLEDLYKYNDDKVCPSVDLTTTLANYDGECTNEFSSQLKKVSETVMNFFYISAPFILIIFGSLDFFKVIVSSDPEQMKKSRTNFFKRLAAFILLYITPFFVKFLFSLTPYELYGTNYVCAHEIDLSSDRSNGGISGTYNGYSYNGKLGAGGSFGPSDGSIVVHVDCSEGYQHCKEGDYVVVDTKYPGGIVGFSKMLRKNGITQDTDEKNWGGCCGGMSQVQACGVHNGMELTQKGIDLAGRTPANCNGISAGCSGWGVFSTETCFNTESEYMAYIISNIRVGIPVITVVEVGKNYGSRHFVTVVGYKADTNGTSADDLLILDSWDGKMDTFAESNRGIGTMDILQGNHPCSKNQGGPGVGNYWASANRN